MTGKTKIYVVEDDMQILNIEKIALESDGYEVYGFSDGRSFLSTIAKNKPDLVVLDVMLPDRDGYAILKELRRGPKTANVPVLMITALTSDEDVEYGLDAGADDYITKPFQVKILKARVRALLRRSKGGEEKDILEYQGLYMDRKGMISLLDGEPLDLKPREFELLYLLLKNAGRTMTRDILMDLLWDGDYTGESRTLDVHINTLRHKMGVYGQMIVTVRGYGYKLE